MSYIRSRRPPLLAVWGKNDPFFLLAGADAFKPRRWLGTCPRRFKKAGRSVPAAFAHVWTVCGDKVVRLNIQTDTAKVLEALKD